MHYAISTRQRQRLRRLVCESLESRQLMAADLVHHNFMMPEDSDMSGDVTPLDALMVINGLNTGAVGGQSDVAAALDVDADGTLSPLDALTVINYINRSIGEDEVLISQVSIQNRIERLDDAMDADLLPPNVDLAMATQIREILRAGGFPEIGDRMVNGVLSRQVQGSGFAEQGDGNGELESENLSPNNDGTGSMDLSDLLNSVDLSGVDFDFSRLNDLPGSNADIENQELATESNDAATLNFADLLNSLKLAGIDFDFSQLDGLLGGDDTGVDFDFLANNIRSGVNDPTNDNGNGSFIDTETAAPIINFIEIELRKQLKVGDDATIGVAVFNNAGEVTSGTWKYVTSEGILVSGNWSYVTGKPETLNLFRSNVEVEKRIYVQYPGSGFIYYSWLPNEPVGYYFSPIGDALDFKAYFDSVPGSEVNSIGGFTSYYGDLGLFDGIAAIEEQASALYAIDLAKRGS